MSKSRIASAVVILALGFMLGLAVNPLVASLSGRASAIAEAQASGTQGPQRMWEYRVVECSIYQVGDQLATELNKLGRQGFDVCGMTANGERQIVVVLRRPGR
jgi:hypothetical protein